MFRKAFTVAFALNEPVEKKLQKYGKAGVIESIARSGWAPPFVVAKKLSNRSGFVQISLRLGITDWLWTFTQFRDQRICIKRCRKAKISANWIYLMCACK